MHPQREIPHAPTPQAVPRRAWLGDAILLALVFLAIAVTNAIVLMMALVTLRGPIKPF